MITMIKKMVTVIKGHSPSLCCFRAQLRRIVLRSPRRKRLGEAGQSIIEYAMFIAVVVLALLAMQVYLKRGLQGKVKDMADQISPALYNPDFTSSSYTADTASHTESNYSRGLYKSEIIYQNTTRSGVEVVYPETY